MAVGIAAALSGPAQVGAQLIEFSFLRRVSPLISARLLTALHPIAAALVAIIGAPAAVALPNQPARMPPSTAMAWPTMKLAPDCKATPRQLRSLPAHQSARRVLVPAST